MQPRIVSNWRRRFADHGLDGLKDQPRAGKKPIYGKVTNKRILVLLDKPPPPGYARWSGPLLAKALGDVDVQYVWRFLREHNIDLAARKSWCESNDPEFALAHTCRCGKNFRFRHCHAPEGRFVDHVVERRFFSDNVVASPFTQGSAYVLLC